MIIHTQFVILLKRRKKGRYNFLNRVVFLVQVREESKNDALYLIERNRNDHAIMPAFYIIFYIYFIIYIEKRKIYFLFSKKNNKKKNTCTFLFLLALHNKTIPFLLYLAFFLLSLGLFSME